MHYRHRLNDTSFGNLGRGSNIRSRRNQRNDFAVCFILDFLYQRKPNIGIADCHNTVLIFFGKFRYIRCFADNRYPVWRLIHIIINKINFAETAQTLCNFHRNKSVNTRTDNQ